MTALFIILSVIFLIFVLLILPITFKLDYQNELICVIKYAGIVLFNSEKRVKLKKAKKKKIKKSGQDADTENKTEDKESFFKKIYNEKGFLGAVRYFFEIAGITLKKVLWVIKKFKFRNFELDIVVATDDAANTAIEYGATCCAVYPVLSFLKTNANFKADKINISADFDRANPAFAIRLNITTRLIYFLIAAISALTEYLKLNHKESEKNGRKQH